MDRSSKNYIPPVKMVSSGGVMLNMSTIKSISVGATFNNDGYDAITVSYINGSTEELRVNNGATGIIEDLMSQM